MYICALPAIQYDFPSTKGILTNEGEDYCSSDSTDSNKGMHLFPTAILTASDLWKDDSFLIQHCKMPTLNMFKLCFNYTVSKLENFNGFDH